MAKEDEVRTFQQRVEHASNTLFAEYGAFVSRHPCKVFWLAFIIMVGLASGMSKFATYEDESLIWTPVGNPSVLARDRAQEMFQSTGGVIVFMAEDKTGNAAGVLTKNAAQEFADFKAQFLAHTHGEDDQIAFDAVCFQYLD